MIPLYALTLSASTEMVWLVAMERLHDSTSGACKVSESMGLCMRYDKCCSYPFKLQGSLKSLWLPERAAILPFREW